MAGKNPAALWYFNDWEKDLAKHPHEIGGAWMLILCELHWHDGDLTQTWTEWSKVLRVSVAKTKRIISVLDQKRIGNITKVPGNRGGVRIVSRRMVNDSKKREANRIRQKEWYHKKDKPNADLTTIQQKPNTPFPVPVPVPVTNKNNNTPPIPPLGDRVPYQKIVDIYHEELPGLSKVRVIGDTLKRAIKSRCRGAKERLDPEWWRKLFRDQVGTSDFLMGKKKDWSANLHFIVRASKFEGILNGVYRNKTTPLERYKNEEADPEAEKKKAEAAHKKAEEERKKQEEDHKWNMEQGIVGY